MLNRYQFKIMDQMLLVLLWPPVLAGVYLLFDEIPDKTYVVIIEVLVSAGLLLGWFMGVKLANDLQCDGWARVGVLLQGILVGPAVATSSILFLVLGVNLRGLANLPGDKLVPTLCVFILAVYLTANFFRLNRLAREAVDDLEVEDFEEELR